ncbi:hypothetical protein SDC9_188732 [bioreactor metagenome]|uniref:Uncharacterized protein n=1 Tax=bioreactor metagenome TaxID=1076179 RepID=A0A645HQQ7_9ZZZZ
MVVHNSVNISLFHIGKGNIVALQKGKSAIIIFKIQGFPHSLRQLVYKAENTFVKTAFCIVHQSAFKNNADIFVIIFFNFGNAFLTLNGFDTHFNVFIIYKIAVVKNIQNLFAVD